MSQSVSEPVSDTISSITSRMERISLPVLPCERRPSAVERVIIKGKVLFSVVGLMTSPGQSVGIT